MNDRARVENERNERLGIFGVLLLAYTKSIRKRSKEMISASV